MDCPNIPGIPYKEFSDFIHSKVAEGRIPISGAIELTFRCNLRCAHCYCTHDSAKKEMSFREICRILDEITNAGCLWLLLTGGEPLLREDFLDIYAYAKKKGMIITLFTNGTLITPHIADYLKEYPPFAVEVSLYGVTSQTYERVTGVPGSFERCMQGINIMIERNIPLELKTMLMTLNKHELWQIKNYAENLGVKFRFDPFLNPKLNTSQEPCQFRISPEEVLEFDLADEKRAQGWREFCEKSPEPVKTELLYRCSAGRSSFHIDPYGNLSVCIIARSPNYDLKAGSFEEGWQVAIPHILQRKKPFAHECGWCELRDLCTLCPGWSELETSDPEMPVEYLCRVTHLRAKAFGFGRYAIKNKEEAGYAGKK